MTFENMDINSLTIYFVKRITHQ